MFEKLSQSIALYFVIAMSFSYVIFLTLNIIGSNFNWTIIKYKTVLASVYLISVVYVLVKLFTGIWGSAFK